MKPLRLVSTSDLHCGYRRFSPVFLMDGYRKLFMPYMDKIDMAMVAGDLFDSIVRLADPASNCIMAFILELLKLAHENNVTLRIMRGTFSHDNVQPSIVKEMHTHIGYTNDVKYIDTVSLEYIERFDMRVLYIPDDVPAKNSDEILKLVKSQMKDLGWDYVDYAFVHGSFDFAFPSNATKLPKILFTSKQFDFVKRKVMVGHHHTPYSKGNILYHGSPDRLCHGEEEPKGMYYIEDDGDKSIKIRFVENLEATTFSTLDYSKMDDEDEIATKFRTLLETLPPDPKTHRPSFIRVLHPKAHIRGTLLQTIAADFPNVVYSGKDPGGKESASEEIIKVADDEELDNPPTEENLPFFVSEYLNEHFPSFGITEERIRELFNIIDAEK